MTLSVPGTEATQVDGSLTTAVVKLTDEDGRVGIGECDGPPPVIKAFIDMKSSHAFWSRGLRELLIGQDPLEIAALWQRIYDSISAKAWTEWIEHSKRIVNEYRLDLTTKKAHDVLKEQCEDFLFGSGGQAPAEYVPVAEKK